MMVRFDSGNELLIHATKARAQYFDLLQGSLSDRTRDPFLPLTGDVS